MRHSKLNQTIVMVDVMLEHHSGELKQECMGSIIEFKQKLAHAQEELESFPSNLGRMSRKQKVAYEKLSDEVDSLVTEVSECLENATLHTSR